MLGELYAPEVAAVSGYDSYLQRFWLRCLLSPILQHVCALLLLSGQLHKDPFWRYGAETALGEVIAEWDRDAMFRIVLSYDADDGPGEKELERRGTQDKRMQMQKGCARVVRCRADSAAKTSVGDGVDETETSVNL